MIPPAKLGLSRALARAGLALSCHAWLVLVTLVLWLGASVAFWKADRRITAALHAQSGGTTGSATALVQRALNIGDGVRLCGHVDLYVHLRQSTPHGDAIAQLQRLDAMIVDGPDHGGLIRLRIVAREPERALVELQRSPLLDALAAPTTCH